MKLAERRKPNVPRVVANQPARVSVRFSIIRKTAS